jgi:N6-adenosine-specific RNA methylase IME4
MTHLVKYDAACRALAEAHSVDEVKNIHDEAVAVQAYARQAKDTRLIIKATEIRMRAERRAGELLIEMAARRERHAGKAAKGSRVATPTDAPTLADLGISKTQSSRWQAHAALDQDDFDAKIEAACTRNYNSMTYRFRKAAQIKEAKERHSKLTEHGCTVTDLVALADSGKRFGVIYADPPWPWETWGGPSGKIRSAPDNHYGTSPLDEIMKLPVARLAADDCALLSWCTGPHIAIGTHTKVIEAWGFKPSTVAFDWVKTNTDGNLHTGMGYYTRSNSEVCLIAIKGAPLRLATDVHQIVMAPVGEHSAKPEEVRRRIERLLPGPYLELYGRKSVPGWTVWGNEIQRDQFVAEVAA